ncbi:MAG: HAD family hydrolase [bacterium]|nr:HAD family hydrolase [bacterium]
MDRVRGVIFDVDGTLADSLGFYYGMACSLVDALDAPAVSRGRVYELMGSGDPDLLVKLFPAGFPDLEARLRQAVGDEVRVWMRRLASETQAFAGSLELLRDLHAVGRPLGIATSSASALPFLDRWGVRQLFSSIVGREHTERRKPHPDPVLRCVRELDLEPGETAYIGDSPIDIEAGRAAGVRTVGVLTGTSTRETLEAVTPDYIIDSVSDLGRLLPGHEPRS